MAEKYDVVVVGAGPAGAAAARRCVEEGLKTLIVEKHKLPRDKNCSGLIAREAEEFVERRFGPIPEDCKSTSGDYLGVALHFPSVPSLYINGRERAANVWRSGFDRFLAESSGAEVMERTRFEKLVPAGGGLAVRCVRGGKKVEIGAKHLVGCDGSRSRVLSSIAPRAYYGLPWFFAYQKYYKGSVDLEKGYFHSFFHREMGIYTWLTFKDDWLLIGCCCLRHEKSSPYHGRLVAFLKSRYNLRITEEGREEGCLGNAMAPLGRFFLGEGRVLVAGEAAGFLHQGGEGISCALDTGHLAGEAIAEAEGRGGADALALYREKARPEMDRVLDQFNLLRMLSTSAHPMNGRDALKGYRALDFPRMILDLHRFTDQQAKGTGIGRAILRNTVRRAIYGKYPHSPSESTRPNFG